MSNFQVFLFSRRPHVASLCALLSSSYYLCTLKPHGIVYNLRVIFQVDRLSWKIRSVANRLICRYFSVHCVSLSPRLPCVLITETLGLRSAKQRSKIVSAECWQDERILYELIAFLPMLQSMHREFKPNFSQCALFQQVHSHLERLCRCTDANQGILTSLVHIQPMSSAHSRLRGSAKPGTAGMSPAPDSSAPSARWTEDGIQRWGWRTLPGGCRIISRTWRWTVGPGPTQCLWVFHECEHVWAELEPSP